MREFGGDETVRHPDYDGGCTIVYICQNLLNCTLKKNDFIPCKLT